MMIQQSIGLARYSWARCGVTIVTGADEQKRMTESDERETEEKQKQKEKKKKNKKKKNKKKEK